jgi:hypothetical protein
VPTGGAERLGVFFVLFFLCFPGIWNTLRSHIVPSRTLTTHHQSLFFFLLCNGSGTMVAGETPNRCPSLESNAALLAPNTNRILPISPKSTMLHATSVIKQQFAD